MGKILRILILTMITATAVIIPQKEAAASHAMGADLTYTCLGGNTYRVRLSFYRDCIGIAAPSSVFINVRSGSCGQNLGVTCDPVPGTGQEVTPLCPSATSSCNGGIFTGIQEWVYEGVITLPMQCNDWTFSYNLCCRNAAITNIASPNSNTFYVYATLDNTIVQCNNSPTFSNKPVPFACLGQQFCFNHGAYDADGDSLVYSLITPYQNATTTVSYNPPFSATDPLTSSPAVSFNPTTGDICMTPTNLEVTVMAVLVQEYRNGVLIGSVERDIQITVLNCNNSLPTLTGINGTNSFSTSVCAGDSVCFFINSNDPDPGQNVFINWDGSIPGATFTSTGGPLPTGNFCWVPTQNDISNNSHCFTVRVNDDACPMVGAQIYSYCIKVNGINVDAGPDQLIACNDLATLNVTASGGTGNYTYLWSNGVTLPIQTVGVGTYIVTVSDGVCSGQDTVQVISAFEPTAAFSASGSCPNAPVQFTDQSTLPGGIITSWNWNFGGTGTSTTQNPVHTFPGPGTYNVTLIIATSLGCTDTITQQVTINTPPAVNFTAGNGCAGSSVTFTNTTTPPGTYSWQWDFGNGQTSNSMNPSVTYQNPGTYNVTLIATDSIGCTGTITQPVTIYPVPIPSFSNTTLLCQGGTVTFTDLSGPGAGATITGWNWNFGNGQTSTSQNPSTTYNSAGNYNVSLTVTNSFGCSATIIQNIGVNPPPVISAGPNQSICLGGSVTLTASGANSYTWLPGGQTGNPITVAPSATTTYTVVATDVNGCTAQANTTVTVNQLPTIVVTPDVDICLGQSTTLTASGAISYYWNPTGNNTNSITVTPGSSTSYAVTGTDANGCSATSFVNVTVNPLPVVNLSNVFMCVGSSATMNAGNPGSTYQWSNGATTQIINVTNPGTYTVTVTNQFGCTAAGSALASQGGSIVNTLQNISFCDGGSAVLDAGNPGNSYLWSNGATSQTITVNSGGAYSVTITDPNGCSGTLSTTVNVNPAPVANFIPGDICINGALQFSDLSTIGSGSIVGWNWDFGDGNVSQIQDPVHNYASSGTYSVTLIVTSNNGCKDTIVRSFDVFPLPQANFSYNFACENQAIQFTDLSFTNMGNITSWFWDFGDGTTSTLQNPSHAFSSSGMQVVTLTVTTAGGCEDTRPRNIHIYPIPSLSFTTSASGLCLGSTVSILNTSTSSNGAVNNWFWDFGDGTTSSSANPSHTYTSPGTYNITLIGTTSHGCIDTVSQSFTIYEEPPADAGPNTDLCFGDATTLTASGGISYLWNTGSTSQSITVSPLTTTTYYVTVTDANGCTGEDSVTVFVKPLPPTNAGPDVNLCTGESATLNGNLGYTMLWTPGGQTTSSITVSPAVTTTYVYTITSFAGCTVSDSVTVFVNPIPQPNLGPDQMICDGTTATLTASGGGTYLWMPGGMTGSSIYVAPTNPTVYTVQVTSPFGCTATDTVSIGINPVPTANLSPAFICIGNSTTLDAGNPGSTYLWYPNGETTQSIVVSDSGYYEVQITNGFGCVGNASVNVVVGGSGLVTNPVNSNVCDGESVTLSAGNPGSTYLWSTGETTQIINVSTSGIYTVVITDPTGCSASFANNVMMNPLPQVSFTADPVCAGAATSINNQSTITSGNITSWSWDFGDGLASSALNPVHTYAAPGTYTVVLTATSGMGCSTTGSLPVTVNPNPSAAFTANSACEGSIVNFTDASAISSGSLSGWNWNFGSGNTSAQQNPVHTFNSPGYQNVSLIVTSALGCVDTVNNEVLIHEVPTPSFVVQNECLGSTSEFINTSTLSNGALIGYNWNFGDGTLSTDTNPTHIYATSGTYNITLTATSDSGCVASINKDVTIYPGPVAAATAQSACSGDSVLFINQSYVSSGSIVNNYWAFGDGGSSNQVNPAHAYTINGTYNAMLVVTSDYGCVDTLDLAVDVHEIPEADFVASNTCIGGAINFNDQSSINNGSIVAWNWNFGDGSGANVQNPSHTYLNDGSYYVKLTVTSDNGCIDSIGYTINVFPNPISQFFGTNVCEGSVAEFYNQSTIAGGSTFTCDWDFGDGNTSTLQNPVHIYNMAGTYNVTLTVTSADGCSNTSSQAITIYAPPTASFIALNACDGSPVNFTDQSVSTNGVISTWDWNFGDGSTSVSANPYHSFPTFGTYNVQLTVTSLYGCTGTVTQPVDVFALPVPVITASSACEYDPTSFNSITAAGDTSTYTYSWSFGDGGISTDQNPVYQYQSPGTFNVSLTMTNGNGCSATASIPVTVSPAPDADFEYTNACAATDIQFTNTSTITSGTIISYLWNFGDGSPVSNAENPVHSYTNDGTYTVTLIVQSDNGCTDTISQQIIIFPLPEPGFVYNQTAGCGPLAVAFDDTSYVSSGNIVAWAWDFGNGETSSQQNPIAIYTQSGTYGVTLTVTTDMGCMQTTTQPNIITVYPGPVASFEPDPIEASILHPVINFNNYSSGGIVYSWSFGDGGTSTQFEPTHTYADTGHYTVTLIVQNSFGCIDTITRVVYIVPEFTLFVPNAFTPNNDGTNDYFNVAGLGIVEVTLNIFNRWGENIYTSTSLNGGWDGTIQKDNSQAQQGVYVYDVRVRDVFGKYHSGQGRVTLVR